MRIFASYIKNINRKILTHKYTHIITEKLDLLREKKHRRVYKRDRFEKSDVLTSAEQRDRSKRGGKEKNRKRRRLMNKVGKKERGKVGDYR